MAVTVRELLASAHDHLTHSYSDERTAALDAVATFPHVARAVDALYAVRPLHQLAPEGQPPEALTLIDAARSATLCWPHAGGPTGDLVGVAADAVSACARTFDDPQRWALTVYFAETARRAVDQARRFAPYANIPHLTAVRDAAVACERRAALQPHDYDPTALDRLIPGTGRSVGLETAVDAAAALHLATSNRSPHRWRLAEIIIVINAAQVATAHAAAWAAHLPTEPGAHPWHRPSLAVAEAWTTARMLCRPFDDTTKLRPPEKSEILHSASRLGRSLLDQLGPAPQPGTLAASHPSADPERAGATLTIVSLLPEITNRTQAAAGALAYNGQLWALHRSLLAHEERGDSVMRTPRVGIATYDDLKRLINTLGNARTLTAAVAADLATTVPARLPDLGRAQVAHAAALSVLSSIATSTHDTARRAHLAVAKEWAVPLSQKPAPRPRAR